MARIKMVHWILIGMVAGLAAGWLFGERMAEIQFIGDIFLRLIQMSIVFLVMGSIVESVGSLENKELGKMGVKIFILFGITTAVAAAVGILFANLFQPGVGLNLAADMEGKGIAVQEGWRDLLVNIVPRNIAAAMAGGQMLPVVFFSLMMGVSVSILHGKESAKTVLHIAKSFNEVMLNLIRICMKMAPIGIFAYLSAVTGKIGIHVVVPLLKYLLAIAVACVLIEILFITLAAMYVKVSPVRLAVKVSRMAMIAAVTTSSAISLPTKMRDSEIKLGVSKRISRLVNPLGMNLNSDGQALFVALASLTIAQFYNMEMTLLDQIVVVGVATATTLGNFTTPGGALVTLAIVIQILGLPMEGLAIVAGVDWFRGMLTTPLNVVDDALIAMIIAKDQGELSYEIFENELPDEE